MTEDDAVETALILELSDYCKPEALLIHLSDGDKVIGRPRHSYYRTRLQTLGAIGRLEKALRSQATWYRKDKRNQ
jgi:hypothetical protein